MHVLRVLITYAQCRTVDALLIFVFAEEPELQSSLDSGDTIIPIFEGGQPFTDIVKCNSQYLRSNQWVC